MDHCRTCIICQNVECLSTVLPEQDTDTTKPEIHLSLWESKWQCDYFMWRIRIITNDIIASISPDWEETLDVRACGVFADSSKCILRVEKQTPYRDSSTSWTPVVEYFLNKHYITQALLYTAINGKVIRFLKYCNMAALTCGFTA